MSSHVSALIPAAAPPLPRAPPLDARGHHKEDARKPPCPLRGAVHGQGLQHRSLHTSEDETRPDIRCINIDAAMAKHGLFSARNKERGDAANNVVGSGFAQWQALPLRDQPGLRRTCAAGATGCREACLPPGTPRSNSWPRLSSARRRRQGR